MSQMSRTVLLAGWIFAQACGTEPMLTGGRTLNGTGGSSSQTSERGSADARKSRAPAVEGVGEDIAERDSDAELDHDAGTSTLDEREADSSRREADPSRPADSSSTRADTPRDGSCEAAALEPSQVIMLGDSYWVANQRGIQAEIESNARAAGALAESKTYRSYYALGATMEEIAAQYDAAIAIDPDVKAVIMDGGGSDILFGERLCLISPPPDNLECSAAVDDVLMRFRQLLARMATDGVEDVVFYFYPHLRRSGLAGPVINETLDFAAPIVQHACETMQGTRCNFVDSRPAFDAGRGTLLGLDGIYPTAEGSAVLGALIWDAMVDHCIGQ